MLAVDRSGQQIAVASPPEGVSAVQAAADAAGLAVEEGL